MRSSSLSPNPDPSARLSARAHLTADQLRDALAIRDLTDPAQGAHAMQSLLASIVDALAAAWGCEVRVHRAPPVVSVRDNYDRLYHPADGVARDARYTRWISDDVLLRSQTSAMIPPALDALAADPTWRDVLLVCPGLVYRRDSIDRQHVAEPHQVDLWRIRRGGAVGRPDLHAMIDTVVGAALPGWRHRTLDVQHPYTVGGLQIDAAAADDAWLEIGECGLARPRMLADAGHDVREVTGLAMGLGLDRLLMLRKGIPDIRLLRAADVRIAEQLLDLAPWRPVSVMPPVRRDLSIAVDADDLVEDLGDRVRGALGARASAVESVEVLSETGHDALPPAARARIGLAPGQKNLLVRVTLRDLERTLTHDEGNDLRDAIYGALHRGSVHQWAQPRAGVIDQAPVPIGQLTPVPPRPQ